MGDETFKVFLEELSQVSGLTEDDLLYKAAKQNNPPSLGDLFDLAEEFEMETTPVPIYAGPALECSSFSWPSDLTAEETALIERVDLEDRRSTFCWLLLVKAYKDQP